MTRIRPIPCASTIWIVENLCDEGIFWDEVWRDLESGNGDRAIRRAALDRSDGIKARARQVAYGPERPPAVMVVVDSSKWLCETCGKRGHRYCMAGLRAQRGER